MFRRILIVLALVAVCSFGFLAPAFAQTPSTSEQLRALAHEAEEGMEAAEQGDQAGMQHAYDEAHELWERIEDDVREKAPAQYVELEAALDNVEETLATADAAQAGQAFDRLKDTSTLAAASLASGSAASPTDAVTVETVLDRIDAARQAVARSDAGQAREQLEQAVLGWPVVEGTVAANSQDDYETIEHELGNASAALREEPANLAAAGAALAQVQTALAPYAQSQHYTALDAAAIILREGLEALLVIVALLAFLKRSGNADKRKWIWVGSVAGILVSIATAFALQALFSSVLAGQNREIIEGVTGLIAAVLLFYVSYWLHSKSSLQSWKAYIDERTTRSLARGNMLGIALLAFLSVFREGAETVVFYLGMAPSITASDLWLGLLAGGAILAGMAVLMLVVGVKLPMRLFFRVAGLLVYYLGFKFVGTGLHALQVAGVLPSNPIDLLPVVPFFGIYPTWQTLVPQLVLFAAAVGVVLYVRSQEHRSQLVTT